MPQMKSSIFDSWNSATGPLTIPLTNDYLFRALLQQNNYVLKGLICSLLKIPPEEVKSVIINNPIVLGESINEKTFLLDVSLTLNDNTLINLELQVINEHNWPERSLSYLCRTFDNLNSGEDYYSVKTAIQIGLLDFTLFPEYPEFYATYQFMNVKNHSVYSDKMRLSVLNLTRIDLATDEDISSGLIHWAALFKANTWEELKMLAQKDEYIKEASATIYQLSQEDDIRLQCEARNDYYRRQRSIQAMLDAQQATIQYQKDTLKANEDIIKNQECALKANEDIIKNQECALKANEDIINNQEKTLKANEDIIYNQKETIAQLSAENTRLLAWAKEHGYQE